MSFLQRVCAAFLDFLYPKSARVLELESASSGELLKILPSPEPIDDESIVALFDYKNPVVKEIIWEIKYNGNKILAQKMSEILWDVIQHELADRSLFENFQNPLLMPIPISDKRRNERGWNQTEIICEEIMNLDKENLLRYKPRQLVKHFHTESQTRTATRRERMENLKESMKLLAPAVASGENVILMDDVTTTGSTFTEAKRVLKEAGARKIICFALAH